MSAPPLRAIACDLYGTLAVLDKPLLHRQLPPLLGVPPRRWLELVRTRLLREPFADAAAMAAVIAGELGLPALASQCERLLEEEVTSARLLPGAVATLEFFKRRGLKLGLVSNLSSVHLEPLHRWGLSGLFDATVLSCLDGVVKPAPEVYRLLCQRLGLGPGEVLMVGDSLANDVRAAAACGLRVARLAAGPGEGVVESVAALGWRWITGDRPLAALLTPGQAVTSPYGQVEVRRLEPVGEEERGRYNLVCRITARHAGAQKDVMLYAKRYLDPASARLEALGHQLQGLCGLPACRATVCEQLEPILLATPAPGGPLSGPPDPPVAHEIGRQFAFGYVFANADLRPRNMLLDSAPSPPCLTTIDLEHILLNLAIDVEELPQRFDPYALDALAPSQLARLVRRRVLTPRTLPRARAEFFDVRTASPAIVAAFSRGFLDQYQQLGSQRHELLALIRERIYTPPFLVAGTRSYRRALAGIDLEDLTARLAEDPRAVLTQLLAPR